MAFVSSWLMQIVLILLFAVVMDLVVPSSSMRNYVKLVMGLVIMVTMLKPVSVLFDNKFDISRIQWPEQTSKFADYSVVKGKADELQRDQQKQAEQQVNTQLEKLVKEQVESAYPLEVAAVQAQMTGEGQNAEVAQLNVTVRAKSGSNSGEIQPVQPVDIQISHQQQPAIEQSVPVGKEQMLKQIKQELAAKLQISNSHISVQWSGNKGG